MIDAFAKALTWSAYVEEARELTASDKIKPLIADLDRVWGNRVSRRREILEIVQEIVS